MVMYLRSELVWFGDNRRARLNDVAYGLLVRNSTHWPRTPVRPNVGFGLNTLVSPVYLRFAFLRKATGMAEPHHPKTPHSYCRDY